MRHQDMGRGIKFKSSDISDAYLPYHGMIHTCLTHVLVFLQWTSSNDSAVDATNRAGLGRPRAGGGRFGQYTVVTDNVKDRKCNASVVILLKKENAEVEPKGQQHKHKRTPSLTLFLLNLFRLKPCPTLPTTMSNAFFHVLSPGSGGSPGASSSTSKSGM